MSKKMTFNIPFLSLLRYRRYIVVMSDKKSSTLNLGTFEEKKNKNYSASTQLMVKAFFGSKNMEEQDAKMAYIVSLYTG